MRTKRALGALAAAAALAAVGPAAAGANVQVGSSGWQWGSPLPQGNAIRSMSFVGQTGYAAGDFGTLLRTADGGGTWAGLRVGSFTNLTTVQALDANTVIAGGGCVARISKDGGVTFARIGFTPVESSCKEPLAGLSFVDVNTGWIVLADGTVVETKDGGNEFTQRTAVPTTRAAGGQAAPNHVTFISATTGYVSTSAGTIYQTTDEGVSWRPVVDVQRSILDVEFTDPLNGYAVGAAGLFLHTSDGGATWVAKDIGAGASDLTSVRCASATTCVMATAKGDVLYRTADSGESATPASASTDPLYAAAFTSETGVVAAGANGSTVVSSDGGVTFAPVGGRLTGSYSAVVAGGQPGTAYAPGDNGSLAVTTDGGATWARGNVATSEDVEDVSFPTAQVGYALDAAGGLFRTSSAGAAWKALDTGSTAQPAAIYSSNPDTALTIGPRGVRRSSDGGDTFAAVKGKAVAKTSLSGADRAGSAVFAYGNQDIIRSLDGGKTWKAINKPGKYVKRKGKLVNRLGIRQVDFVTASTGYVRDQYDRIFKTTNGGKSYTWLTAVGGDDAVGMAFSGNTGYLVIPTFGDTDSRDTSGFLLRTDNGGKTWHPQFVTDAAIAPRGIASGNGTDYLLGGTSGLLATKNGGDAGSTSTLTLTTPRTKITKPATVTVTGRLQPASGFEQVTVSYLPPGKTRWQHQTVKAAGNGAFTTSWRVAKGVNTFVAQWAGDFRSKGTGTKVLTVTVSKKKKGR